MLERRLTLLQAVADVYLAAYRTNRPVTAAVAEVQKCALVCRHYAEHAEAYLADEEISTPTLT